MDKITGINEIADKNLIGGKAKGLIFLHKNDFKVPEFYVLDFKVIDGIIKGKIKIADRLKSWIETNAINTEQLWAVRSSANLEDGENKSYAGLFRTEINIKTTDLEQAIASVLETFIDSKNKGYQNDDSLQFAIILQKMIVSEFSGVVFSHNPNNLNENNVFLNIIPGLGEILVSGKEEALSLKFENDNIVYLTENKEYKGQTNQGSLKNITYQAHDLKQKIHPFYKPLSEGAKKLSKLKNHPVDIEFTIANNTIYWLQVRPITALSQEEKKYVWDNSNIGDNYPDFTSPLSISFVQYTYLNAYSSMAVFLGMKKSEVMKNRPLFNNMVGGIYGRLYYNVTNWQQLLYKLPFGNKTSKHITSIWAMDSADFIKPKTGFSPLAYLRLFSNILLSFIFFSKHKSKFESIYKNGLNYYEDKDFSSLSNSELIADFKKVNKDLGAKWIVPVLNGFFAFLLFSLLKKTFKKSRLYSELPNFINDILYSQGDVVSVDIVKQFQELVNEILGNDDLKHLFNKETEEFIYNKLSTAYKPFKLKIDNYIRKYGERCGGGELKIETINYKENPLLFISVLKANAVGNVQTKKDANQFSYKQIINKKYRFNPLKRILLSGLIKKTLNRVRDRENYRFYRTKGFDIVRRIFRAIDLNLLKEQRIENSGDSYYLKLNELIDSNASLDLKELIEIRKKEYADFKNKRLINRYLQHGKKFIPAETKELENIKGEVKGIGCCSGLITEEVVIITGDNVDQGGIEGKILVASYFEPGWINLFSKASGIISERGSLLSHTAILCREMGIPAIVGAKGILSAVKNGSVIQMDGALGLIKITNNISEYKTTDS